MVFMIKLPPALAMSPPVEQHRKDDRLSLLTNLHRSYGQSDNGIQPYGQEAASVQQQFSQQHHRRNTNLEPEKIFCLRQQFLMAAAIIVVASLVVFVLFVTTFRRVPNDDSFLNIDPLSGAQGFSNMHRQVAVKTSCGHVIGKTEDGAYVFKGIAYATPPVGTRRWRKPVPLWVDSAWCDEHQTQEAFTFGSKCFQLNPYTKLYEGSEDCLFLNVWTPSLDSSRTGLEVMVWIHGVPAVRQWK
ncbi:Para-nitrobenzyl esterase like protein [Argiope bruennichi]|uniref:Para-nitrobenzyl esterase like protein n=1 Tax=Argiope bruennichi TaxID=94029 RepID=A0A8T0E9J7_ARGBR|nr:Para-nitrobenzyl esterase like protein [Argiope bruennichi]